MSQAQVQVQVHPEPVLRCLDKSVNTHDSMRQNMVGVLENVVDVAGILSIMHSDDKLTAFQDLISGFGNLVHDVDTHKAALFKFKSTYEPSLDATDFQSQINAIMQQELQRSPYDPSKDKTLCEFLEEVGQKQAPTGAMDDDEDLQVGGTRFASEKCPLTMKPLMEIEDPVIDELNYVYERAAILQYIRCNPTSHPVAGVRHIVTRAGLKEAKGVKRMQRNARLMAIMQGPAPAAGPSQAQGEEVLDCSDDDE